MVQLENFLMASRTFVFARCLLAVCLFTSFAAARKHTHEHDGYRSGTREWGILNLLGTKARHELHAGRQVSPLGAERPAAAVTDVGAIAVINDDGKLSVAPNAFDLQNRSLRFTPAEGGHRLLAGNDPVDTAAAAAGSRLPLGDDDTREVQIGFAFPFFGRSYTSLFVNSDGNLTFNSGEGTVDRTLAQFLTGQPRISPFFNDLDPSVSGQVTLNTAAGRFVVTWTEVREFGSFSGPRQTFQVRLFPDGRIEFSYGTTGGVEEQVVVGISPGAFTSSPRMVDLSAGNGSVVTSGPVVEVFAVSAELNVPAVAQKFYETHEDAYDFIVMWTNYNSGLLDEDGFAFAAIVANSITGIGLTQGNFSAELGSAGRASTLLMMENLTRYPDDPLQVVPLLGENNTISVFGQEAGHRWLAYVRYPIETNPRSTVLLGRDNTHWSFFFNSEASVAEGNEIRDNGDGTFTTTDTVKRYSPFDQYIIGLRAPEEVPPSFVVTNPSILGADRSPRTGITFRGTRLDVTAARLVEANGRRLPTSALAQKDFSFAFIVVGDKNSPVTNAQIQKIERVRQEWVNFWGPATGGRSRANTRFVRALSVTGLPAATVPGVAVTARLRAGAASSSARTFTLASSAPGTASAPAFLTIAANTREVEFRITPGLAGTARITATAEGHETADGVVTVGNAATLQLTAVAGSGQVAAPSARLAQPLVAELRDSNALPVPGAALRFSAPAGVTFGTATPTTDANGRAQTTVTLGPSLGSVTITATVAAVDAARVNFTAAALTPATVPAGSAVNGASFAPAPARVSPGSIISIFGTNLAGETRAAASLPLPTTLSSVTVLINNTPAPLFLVSPTQLNVQVPFEVSGSTATLTVNNGTSPSAPITMNLAGAAPGIFTTLQNGSGPGAVTHGDGALVSATSPARADEVLSIFCTGLGAVTPLVASGRAAPGNPPAAATLQPTVTIAGRTVEVLFAGLAPGFAGLYQVNVRVPSGIAAGTHPLVITSTVGSNSVTLAIQ